MSAAAVERQQASRQATERDTRRREKEQAERDRPAATFFRPCSLSRQPRYVAGVEDPAAVVTTIAAVVAAAATTKMIQQ